MKTLLLDIENTPNIAHVWGLFDQTVSLSQLQESWHVMCFAAQWYGSTKVEFYSDYHNGHDDMVVAAHRLVDQADAVVHYNGTHHDMRHLRREWFVRGMLPPSPTKDIDLLSTIRSQFKFTSTKLDFVLKELGLPGKAKHSGHDLWVRCMANDPTAWAQMKRYNIQDVKGMVPLYERALPWIRQHPNVALHNGDINDDRCPQCGGAELRREGWSYTQLARYQRYQCVACGKWSRSGKADVRVDMRAA